MTKPCLTSSGAARARGVRVRLGANWALDGVDLELQRGEVVGLLGPNGAGKTTLLHTLAGLLEPHEGRVEIAGRDPTDPNARRLIGFAPQATAIYEELSAEENLEFFARIHGLRGSALRVHVQDALEFAGLTERRRDRARTLSGGMKRRLHVATAIVHAPAVLLLDEPTVGVDAGSREHLMQRLASLECAILYASHHLDEIERLCARTITLARGRVSS